MTWIFVRPAPRVAVFVKSDLDAKTQNDSVSFLGDIWPEKYGPLAGPNVACLDRFKTGSQHFEKDWPELTY